MRRALDRVRGLRILRPLARRDYALLAAGSTVSLLGDGFFYVALAWQVYEISNVPTALSLVGVAWTLPMVLFLLVGGVLSDRHDRRRLMVLADLLRAAAIGTMGLLSMLGVIELWHIMVLIAVAGLGDALFNPASTALLPEVVPAEELPQANALFGLIRPLMVRIVGPALGGITVGALGPGTAFAVDGASFLGSAALIGAMTPGAPRAVDAGAHGLRRTLADVGEGLRFVRANPWCWTTLLAAMLSLLVFFGPVEVLLPYLVKNRLGLGPDALGLIFAASGVGSIVAAVAVGQLSIPGRRITTMYVAWTIGTAALAGYGLMTELWQPMLIAAIMGASFMLGQVIWNSLLQELVPRDMLGRVSSLDWLVSIGLVPLSFALTGPVSSLLGATTTMIGGPLLAAALTFGLLFVRGVRDPERHLAPARAGAAATGAAPPAEASPVADLPSVHR
ncbi:MAG TPA: MFS transporter [Candidatus Limnocylindria bacterium]|nr:MFS transporter [Candidatus Limnocylindria bacterium]